MKKLKHYTAASLGLILFVSVIALSVPQSGHSALTPPDKDVRVINTATEAVPVTIQGTPSVQAQQSGPWNVGVSGSVQVGNSEAAPIYVRDVDRPTARPFLKEITLTLPAANNGENVSLGILVGELVVIEQVSALGTLDNVYHSHLLQFNKLELNPGTNMYTVPSQQVRIYAGPGSFARMSRVGNGTIATVRFVISGYYANE
jgi:hypothetical protein